MVGALLVALVQSLKFRKQQPHREGQTEEQHLPARLDAVAAVGWKHNRRDGECHCDADGVRRDQRAMHDPATAAVRRHALAASYKLLAKGVGCIQRRNQSSIAGLVDIHPLPRSPEFLLPGLPVEPNRETTLS